MTPRDDATEAQVRSSDPSASTWLAANAGSGKTRVLTDRVARLLLDGVLPQNILCLTYTKAAASEMQNRLFKRLGAWAMLGQEELASSLRQLGMEGQIDADRLRKARRLFARAIETPGGLKIQTIHSFCSALLRRFPLEAGVSPQFSEIEERAADLLRADVLDAMADGPDAKLLANLAMVFEGEDLSSLTRDIAGQAEAFEKGRTQEDIWRLLDLPKDASNEQPVTAVLTADIARWLPEAIAVLKGESDSMQKLADRLAGLNIAAPGPADFQILINCFLRKSDGQPNSRIPTKKAQQALGQLSEPFLELMERTATAFDQQRAFVAADRSLRLHQFAHAFLQRYAAEKQARGWLDFDDLINRARNLLTDPAVAAWVLYRIDGGIDHILVDEAQDTSPAQWDVIRKLAAEFSAGSGGREDTARTIFVVGDKKQSIYSFQGADPRAFDEMEAEFQDRLRGASLPFQKQTLAYSFRSSRAILQLVDAAFANAEQAGFVTENGHIAFRPELPGRVDLWPVVPKQDAEPDRAWYDPLDRSSEAHHSSLLADRIAHQIESILDPNLGETIPFIHPKTNQLRRRPVQPGDFLILFQGRSLQSQNSLFSAVIRSLKARNLPVAGADRLRVGAELAVRDLKSLLAFLAMQEDCLSLASALKSPLFGWDEAMMFDLAHGRGKQTLWQVLRHRNCAATYMLKDLRAQVDFLRPFDLLERILTRHGGRKHILARLGAEAEDGINALLNQALAYEKTAVPSLTGFLVWMETDDLMIKRQVDSASNQIRVMTVHGAKGLEAPIVILPDCNKQHTRIENPILSMSHVPVWKTRADAMPKAMSAALDLVRDEAANERMRLLYVALTRAEKWLIVAAAGELPAAGNSWYQCVDTALGTLGPKEIDAHGLSVKRYEFGDWSAAPHEDKPQQSAPGIVLPDYLQHAAPSPAEPRATVSPSELGGPKALPGQAGWDEERAKAYGTLVHQFIELLSATPPEEQAGLVVDDDPMALEAHAEALRVIGAPDLAFLFDPSVLTEVTLAASWGSRHLLGIADKLVIAEDDVIVVDFKTNRDVPATADNVPAGILRQMGAYVHALTQIYPQKEVTAALVWTRSTHYMLLPHESVTQALALAEVLDAPGRAT
ncbi:MAG: double-strand break repair helicase AddA [Pseudomonadota bacterium]